MRPVPHGRPESNSAVDRFFAGSGNRKKDPSRLDAPFGGRRYDGQVVPEQLLEHLAGIAGKVAAEPPVSQSS
jgi:hypothetical protein